MLKPIPDELFPWNVSTIEEFLYYCCPECDLKTKNHEEFLNHAITSHKKAEKALGGQTPYDIKQEENEPIEAMDYLAVEMKVPLNFECYACETYFESEQTLMKHVDEHHKKCSSEQFCVHCNATFSSHILHMDHLARVHLKPMVFQCDYCPFTSRFLFDLKQHKLKHCGFKKPAVPVVKKAKVVPDKPKQWECYACGEIKMTEHELMEHVLVQHKRARGAKKCMEPDCGKSFQKHILLLEHLAKAHGKEMRFYCDYCEAHTKTLSILKQHKRREHSMEIVKENSDPQSMATTSVFQCYYCGNVYGEKKNCMNHVKRNHSENVTQHMYGTPFGFQCPDCKMMFKNEVDLKLHICGMVPNYWTNENDIEKCPQCGESFKTYDDVLYHFAIKHTTEMRFKCHKCDFKAKHPKEIQAHWKRNECDEMIKRAKLKKAEEIKAKMKEMFMAKTSEVQKSKGKKDINGISKSKSKKEISEIPKSRSKNEISEIPKTGTEKEVSESPKSKNKKENNAISKSRSKNEISEIPKSGTEKEISETPKSKTQKENVEIPKSKPKKEIPETKEISKSNINSRKRKSIEVIEGPKSKTRKETVEKTEVKEFNKKSENQSPRKRKSIEIVEIPKSKTKKENTGKSEVKVISKHKLKSGIVQPRKRKSTEIVVLRNTRQADTQLRNGKRKK